MASPPYAYSPAGSPPHSSVPLPSKKRGSTAADLSVQPSSIKRRKASTMSIASQGSSHPLRQTSFPPDESQVQTFSPSYRRSPSIDTMSLVSGSQVSGAPGKKKRGRKSKAERASEAAAEATRDGTSSVAGGRAGTVLSNASGNNAGKDGDADNQKEEEFEIPENIASMSASRTEAQEKKEETLRAMLKGRMDPEQFDRYEIWHRLTLKPAEVKRHINSITSQSCPSNVHQMMQTVLKLYLGEIVEEAREVQEEWINLGEKQTDLPDDELQPMNEMSKFRRQAPLRPEHLREASRRLKASTENGGSVGSLLIWNQQRQSGVERFAVKAGGRRLFK
ncbi:TAFII28-domain-containing protein [Jackrogersella minutella]|nr:TAFII28-domain-containing protein [Jackrogersella minutella]